MRHSIPTFIALFILILAVNSARASPTGPRNNFTGSPPEYQNCTVCHFTYEVNSGAGSLTLSGLPAAYTQGQTYPLTITVADPQAMRWGFQVTAVEPSGNPCGEMIVTDSVNTQWNDNPFLTVDIIMHTLTGSAPGTSGSNSWTFYWQAPMNDNGAFFHYSGNAGSNGNFEYDDYIYNDVMFIPSVGAPNLEIELTYLSGSPVPVGGGNLNFGVFVANNDIIPLNYDAWLDVVHEGGAPSTVVLRSFTNYQPGWQINRPDMFFPIPSGYAAGDYMFYGRVGEDDQAVWAQSGFPFEKAGALSNHQFIPFIPANVPDIFGPEEISALDANRGYELISAYPNPFNPVTAISFQQSAFSHVNLTVYDVSGRKVATLVDGYRDVGLHEVTFDGTGLASGVYLYRLEAGDHSAMGKMMLLK